MKNFLVCGIFLDMGRGEVKMFKSVKATTKEKAIKLIHETYLTIEILSIEEM